MSPGDDIPSAMHPSSRRRGSELLTATESEGLLAGLGVHPEAPAVQHALASLLDSAAGPPTGQELAGEVAAVAAFLLVSRGRNARHARVRNRSGILARRGQATVAAVGAGIVVAFSGGAVANALPAPIQELAHKTFGAPAPDHATPAPEVHASFPGHGGPDHGASPGPPAQGRHGKARAGKTNPAAGSAQGKVKSRTVPPGHQRAEFSVTGLGKG